MHSDTYAAFLKLVRELNTARTIEALLDWDQEAIMPRRGAEDRANQAAFIAGIAHERLTSNELGRLLEKLESAGDSGDPAAAANVREVRREFNRAVKLPTALVQDIARAVALAKETWAAARKQSAFSKFAPHLEKLLDLKRDVADRVGWNTEPYDALMDEFEPGAKAADVQAVFDKVRAELVPLVQAIASAPRKPDLTVLERHCPTGAQAAFNRTIAQALGFDFDAGRIDTTTHPFCSGLSPLDVRLTTRYDEKYMPMSLFGIMHETGHGLYEQGFDPANTGTPMAQAVSLGIHESQSRMWENQVGRSRPFWNHFFPQLQAAFPSMKDVSLDAWAFGVNNVRPSLIRVEADEVTYGLHIMLRFDLERRMIRGELAVKDIPAAWNDGMKSLLGITPPNDAQGCLQDIHWSLATFGYFPTYALGNLYAAQFFDKARQELGDLDATIARGELQPLREWLREKIHRHGKRYRAAELVKVVTGRDLSHQPFVDYLKGKFRPLYGLA
jgi:carboxypeptidase Taq